MRTLLARAYRALGQGFIPGSERSFSSSSVQSCVLESLEDRRLLSTTYYVSPYGSDGNSGRSSSSAFKSIDKINSLDLNPGDKVLFQGGKTFYGSLDFRSEDAGSSSSPITVGSYGSGMATIKSGSDRGLAVTNAGGYVIRDLKFIGGSGSNYGIKLNNNTGSGKFSYYRLYNLNVSGYGEYGITVVGEGGSGGLNDVRIDSVYVHNNKVAGIKVHATHKTRLVHSKIHITDTKAAYNYGDPNRTVSGSGIEISNVDGATVERSMAWKNSAKGHGAIGIWAHDANKVLFQYNEVWGQNTASSADGGGFGFDTNTSNSVMQYNYSHHNAGHGFGLAQWRDNDEFTNVTIRYNIAHNNGVKNGYSGITVWGGVKNTHIYNNTVWQDYQSSKNGQPNRAMRVFKSGVEKLNGGDTTVYPENVYIRNNVFIAKGGARLIDVDSSVLQGARNLVFQGNAYWTYGSSFRIEYGGSSYSSLSSWRSAKGQEKLNGRAVGYQVDPKFHNPGRGWTVANPDLFNMFWVYKLKSDSPLLDRGLSVGPLAGLDDLDVGAGILGV